MPATTRFRDEIRRIDTNKNIHFCWCWSAESDSNTCEAVVPIGRAYGTCLAIQVVGFRSRHDGNLQIQKFHLEM